MLFASSHKVHVVEKAVQKLGVLHGQAGRDEPFYGGADPINSRSSKASVRPRHTILYHAAAGGVGYLVCQWANALGATEQLSLVLSKQPDLEMEKKIEKKPRKIAPD
ncbi:putative alcohol dehydrogenase superfamily protein [Tanacetum coccineum]|uniref:Alcohol dehydrogenase superfamily protein n=1 Tax=Tanacetum coccineum TaxID=301880 RepID=A0ABQ5H3R1_9ASTR